LMHNAILFSLPARGLRELHEIGTAHDVYI
jgi:hypothetical protein